MTDSCQDLLFARHLSVQWASPAQAHQLMRKYCTQPWLHVITLSLTYRCSLLTYFPMMFNLLRNANREGSLKICPRQTISPGYNFWSPVFLLTPWGFLKTKTAALEVIWLLWIILCFINLIEIFHKLYDSTYLYLHISNIQQEARKTSCKKDVLSLFYKFCEEAKINTLVGYAQREIKLKNNIAFTQLCHLGKE